MTVIVWLAVTSVAFSNPADSNTIVAKNWGERHWVWSKESKSPLIEAPAGKRYFRKTFDLSADATVKTAEIQLAVDNSCEIYLNGVRCGSAGDWSKVVFVDFKTHLKFGRNVIAIEAVNAGNDPSAAGLIGLAVLAFQNDVPPLVVPIDETWKVSKEAALGWQNAEFDDSAWGNAEAIAMMGSLPWGMVERSERSIPELFPRFIVSGLDKSMESLRQMFFLHYSAGGGGTLWDGWIPMATLWPATAACPESGTMRRTWRTMLSARRIDAEGYVSCHQHKGLAHSEGWPFPLWMQAGGIGWQFSLSGLPYGAEFGVVQTVHVDGWTLTGAQSDGFDHNGWKLRLEKPRAKIATPAFGVDPFVAPFIRLEWAATGLDASCKPYMEWTTKDDPNFSPYRRIYFSPVVESNIAYTMIAAYKIPTWKGKITQLRFNFDNAAPCTIIVKSLITAVDSRHTINNAAYLQGCDDYINLTGDLTFLRENIQKMRLALRYAISEFGVDKTKCVTVPWVGHDGRSGIERDPNGRKTFHIGRGIGGNYWDLLPFGGKDALATIYYYDIIRRMAALERQITLHPEWGIPTSPLRFESDDLSRLAAEVKDYAGKLFWNPKTGRFVSAMDIDGKTYDYGFTMVNCEAIYYGFATTEQAQSIVDWISGKRMVEGDSSQGEDIYHWRFAPRATTLRNLDYYAFVWPQPEQIAWGNQVQDGGAVLGFSYHDIMSRLKINGPNDAWQRLEAIVGWFDEVQAAGGYRAYYSVPGRGTLQGGGPAGGLGVDKEFSESVLVPQIMLYGFMGFQPRIDGFAIHPQLPKAWPSLTITRINLHNVIMAITASEKRIEIAMEGQPDMPLFVFPPYGSWEASCLDDENKTIGNPARVIINGSKPGIQLDPTRCRVLVLEHKSDK
jgi:hypothetical protein